MIKAVADFIDTLPKKRINGLIKAQDRYTKLKKELEKSYLKINSLCTHAQTDVEVVIDDPGDTYGNHRYYPYYYVYCKICKKKLFSFTQ